MSENDREMDSLLAAERKRPEPEPAVKAAVAAKVAAVLGGAAGGALGAAITPRGAGAAAAGSGVALKVGLGIVLGAIVGGGIVAATLPPRVVIETREVVVPASARSEEKPVPSAGGATPTSSGPESVALANSHPAAPSTRPLPNAATAMASSAGVARDVDLARERALVDRARSALARGDSAAALAAADEHQKAFPRGQLTEEREVIAIQALAAGGRAEEAGSRAGAFRRAYPGSLLLPLVDAALRPR